jgi:phospholipid-binding lipoprotein MlaA
MVRRRSAVAAVLCGAGLLLAVGPTAAEPLPPVDPSASASLESYDPLFDDDELEAIDGETSDPFETGNRWIFDFNEDLDCRLLDPITRVYQFLVPTFARRGVIRFFANLNAPVSFTNELLQLRPNAAGVTLTRFVSNSTIGVGGLFDPADVWFGLEPRVADFGQTLSRYGIPSGPYLVIPLFGPSTARDTVGTVVDQALNPLAYIAGPLNLQWRLLAGGGRGLSLKDSNRASLRGLRGSSVDFYAALRSAYLQSRHAVERQALGMSPIGDDGGLP